MDVAKFECVASNLDKVVEEGAEASEGVGRAEEGDVTKLDEHLEVVIEGPLVFRSAAFHLDLTDVASTSLKIWSL